MPIEFACPVCSKRFKVDEKHGGRKTSCKACGAEMTVPSQGEEEAEITGETSGGSTLYDHSNKVKKDLGMAVGDEELIEAVSAHIEQHFGPIETVWHELISEGIHVDIYVVKPTAERPFYTLITSGMSELPMTVPPGAEELAYAELVLCLPADWPLTQEAFEDEANYWPIRWMKILARFPHDYETFFTVSHTIPGGNPPEEFDASTPMGCWMFVPPFMFEPESWEMKYDGHDINFLYMLPLHLDEMEYKLKVGYDEAVNRIMDAFEALELMDMQRPSLLNFDARGGQSALSRQVFVDCECGEMVQAQADKAGRSIPCPKCGKPVYMPCSTLATTGNFPEGAAASHPAGVRVNHVRYCLHRPIELYWWGLPALLFVILGVTIHWGFYVPVLILVGLFALRARAISGQYREGDSRPGVIVSIEPPLVASSTDLDMGAGSGPHYVVRIQKLFTRKINGEPIKLGQKIPMAAVYEEDPEEGAKTWKTFHPAPIAYGNSDPAAAKFVMSQIDDDEWNILQEGLKQVPRPFAIGQYEIKV